MKKPLFLSSLLFLLITHISCAYPPNINTPTKLGEELFKIIKANDLKAFRSYFITLDELNNCYYNKSVLISEENHKHGMEVYKKEITDSYYSNYLDKLRKHEDFEWTNAVYETTEVSIINEDYGNVYKLTILFLVNGERKRINRIKAMKIKLGPDGKGGEKFVIGDF